MAGFIVYRNSDGAPVRVLEYANFSEAATDVVHQVNDEELKYDIFSCRDREVLAARRPELAALLRPQDPEPAKILTAENDEINPELRRTTMACGSKPKKKPIKPKK